MRTFDDYQGPARGVAKLLRFALRNPPSICVEMRLGEVKGRGPQRCPADLKGSPDFAAMTGIMQHSHGQLGRNCGGPEAAGPWQWRTGSGEKDLDQRHLKRWSAAAPVELKASRAGLRKPRLEAFFLERKLPKLKARAR